MSKEAIKHYEAALKEAFPSGATGDVFHHWNEARKALAEQPAQQLPVGVGGGLVAIKTLLSRDPCAHAKVAIEMIDAMLSEQPAQQEPKKDLMYSTVAMQERHAAFVDRAVATLEQAKREALAERPAVSAGPITPAMMQGPTPEQKSQMVAAMSKLAEQPAQQEPVAMWDGKYQIEFGDLSAYKHGEHSWTPLYTSPQPAQRTPAEVLDWLADQHRAQCGEDRPIQEWIRKMKGMLP